MRTSEKAKDYHESLENLLDDIAKHPSDDFCFEKYIGCKYRHPYLQKDDERSIISRHVLVAVLNICMKFSIVPANKIKTARKFIAQSDSAVKKGNALEVCVKKASFKSRISGRGKWATQCVAELSLPKRTTGIERLQVSFVGADQGWGGTGSSHFKLQLRSAKASEDVKTLRMANMTHDVRALMRCMSMSVCNVYADVYVYV